MVIQDADVVKIDLGAHIDGFIAVVAHTFVVGATKDKKVTGKKADVITAAHMAAEAALRLVKGGAEVCWLPPLNLMWLLFLSLFTHSHSLRESNLGESSLLSPANLTD